MVLRADKIEPIVFSAIAEYIGKLQENDDVLEEVEENQQREKRRLKEDLAKEQQELEKIQKEHCRHGRKDTESDDRGIYIESGISCETDK